MAATTRITIKAMPAPMSARSKRGERALPPEAKIRTAKKTSTAQNAENMSGPLTEVRRLARFSGFLLCQGVFLLQPARIGVAVLLPRLFYAG